MKTKLDEIVSEEMYRAGWFPNADSVATATKIAERAFQHGGEMGGLAAVRMCAKIRAGADVEYGGETIRPAPSETKSTPFDGVVKTLQERWNKENNKRPAIWPPCCWNYPHEGGCMAERRVGPKNRRKGLEWFIQGEEHSGGVDVGLTVMRLRMFAKQGERMGPYYHDRRSGMKDRRK